MKINGTEIENLSDSYLEKHLKVIKFGLWFVLLGLGFFFLVGILDCIKHIVSYGTPSFFYFLLTLFLGAGESIPCFYLVRVKKALQEELDFRRFGTPKSMRKKSIHKKRIAKIPAITMTTIILHLIAVASFIVGTVCYVKNVDGCRINYDGDTYSIMSNMTDPFSLEAGLFWDLALLLVIIAWCIRAFYYTFINPKSSKEHISIRNVCVKNEVKRLTVICTVFIVMFILGAVVPPLMFPDSPPNIFAILVLILAVTCCAELGYNRYLRKLKAIQEQHMIINEDTNTVTLLQRSYISVNMLSSEPVVRTHYTFHPSEIKYTGVTVGNVHTGGFYSTDPYITEHNLSSSTGKSHLFIVLEKKKFEIERIILPPELLADAKKNPSICKFIVDNYISLRNGEEQTTLTVPEVEMMKRALSTNDYTAIHSIKERSRVDSFLDTEDVNCILRWISNR